MKLFFKFLLVASPVLALLNMAIIPFSSGPVGENVSQVLTAVVIYFLARKVLPYFDKFENQRASLVKDGHHAVAEVTNVEEADSDGDVHISYSFWVKVGQSRHLRVQERFLNEMGLSVGDYLHLVYRPEKPHDHLIFHKGEYRGPSLLLRHIRSWRS